MEVTHDLDGINHQFTGVRKDGDTMLIMDGGDGFRKGQMGGNEFLYPEGEHMTLAGGDFHTGHDLKGIAALLAMRPQTALDDIMIGDGDDIQMIAAGDMIQKLLRRG
jgi:hypothetical protein